MKRILGLLILSYLRFWARLRIRRTQPRIIGITGSSGKTSTLQACQAVLATNTKLKVSHHANSESGIPLNILNLHATTFSPFDWLRICIQAPFSALYGKDSHQTYLAELGIDSPRAPKNMEYLLSIIKPDVGIYLGASAVHAENFDHLVPTTEPDRLAAVTTLIAAEKGKLITSLPANGIAIVNLDDPYSPILLKETKAKKLRFGTHSDSDVRLLKVNWMQRDTIFSFQIQEKRYQLQLQRMIVPEVFGLTLAAAIACGIAEKISIPECITALETGVKLPPGRSSILDGVNGSRILDSSYNSSTQPLLSMLEVLAKVPAKRRLALLGDMREMGAVTEGEHQKVVLEAATICDKLYLVGPLMKQYALPKLEQRKIAVSWYPSAQTAAHALKSELTTNDLLLVKGSQNTLLLEIAVEALLANPADAKYLCRRGRYWDTQRRSLQQNT